MDETYKFGKLMGVRYDAQEHSLYLNDYLSDKIEKLKFVKKAGEQGQTGEENHFKMASLEPILKSDYLSTSISHIALNPIMSVEFDGYVYWADYEEGVRTSQRNSTCFRSIYKVREPLALRLVFVIGTAGSSWSSPQRPFQSPDQSLIGLKSLNVGNNLKYPPDYLNYFVNTYIGANVSGELAKPNYDSAALNSGSRPIYTSFSIFVFVFISLSRF